MKFNRAEQSPGRWQCPEVGREVQSPPGTAARALPLPWGDPGDALLT